MPVLGNINKRFSSWFVSAYPLLIYKSVCGAIIPLFIDFSPTFPLLFLIPPHWPISHSPLVHDASFMIPENNIEVTILEARASIAKSYNCNFYFDHSSL